MGKVSNCLRMLLLLKSRGRMQIWELAAELGVSERSIRSYKAELEELPIIINSSTGPYGGYFLPQEAFLPVLNLNEMELTALLRAKEVLRPNKSFLYQNDLNKAMEKIIAQSKIQSLVLQNHMIQKSTPNINSEDYKRIYIMIDEAIQERKKIKMQYRSLKKASHERILHPYALFLYQGFWYVIGHCEHRNEIRSFKLNRIREMQMYDEGFDIQKGFILEDYVGQYSIYKGNEVFVKLKIQTPMSIIVSEYIWCTDQKIHPIDEGSILFEGTFPLSPETRTWILSMGCQVEILEPLELKEEIKNEIEAMREIYQ